MLVMEHADYNSEEPAHLWHQSILRVLGAVSDAFERQVVLNETRCRGFRSNRVALVAGAETDGAACSDHDSAMPYRPET